MPSPVLIVLLAIVAADVLWWWYADRRARRWRNSRAWRLLLGLFVGGQIGLVVWTLGGRAFATSSLARPPQLLSAAGYLWHLVLLPTACLLLAARGLLSWMWRAARREAPVPAVEAGEVTTRRQFLEMVSTATPMLLTGAGVAWSQTQMQEFRVRSMEVALPGLPPELDGLRIALVSDLHVGTFTHGPTVRRIVEATNRLDADLVLLPGDLINNSLADLSDALDAVDNLQSRYGSYLSIGNHDLIEDGAEFVRRVKARAPLLVNESRLVPIRGQLVQLLGLPWNREESQIRDSVEVLARQLTPGAFPILLAHHPHAFDAAAAAGIPLTVSGHTHGGQLMLRETLGFGPLLYRYWSGLYRKPEANGVSLVVSNGVGNWFPLRTNAPAEILELTLRSADRTSG